MTLPPIIDTHIHLDDPAFNHDRHKVVRDAREAGVGAMIIPATAAARWKHVFACADQYCDVHPAIGLHPLFCDQHKTSDLLDLETQLSTNNAIAIGECGLDNSSGETDLDIQHEYFRNQLDLAAAFALPVIVHAQAAVEDVILAIKSSAARAGVVHSYNGSPQQARRLIDLGFYLGLGGALTWPRARKLQELARDLPLSSLLLETDAPFQPVVNRRQRRNEPHQINKILDTITTLRRESRTEILQQCNHNAQRLFNLSA